jgi:hypothetical protein
MPVSPEEIIPGLVVQLDTTMLRTLGGCETNAVQNASGDRAVVGVHDFLVVGVDAATGRCTAVPLFDKPAVGSEPLVETHKSGYASGWIGTPSYFSHWQHWRIPSTAIVRASGGDPASATDRRKYSPADRSVLDDVKVWESHNRAPYRAV